MKFIKKIGFSLFSVFLCYHSFNLIVRLMHSQPNDFSDIDFVIMSFILCLFITGIFAFPGFVFPTNRIIGKSYYKLKNPNRLKKIYKHLGLRYFRKFLLIFFWGFKKNRKKYFSGNRAGIYNFIYQTKQSEFGHLGALVVIFIVSIALAIKGYLLMVLLMMIINVIGNFYPIILQRYHRVRLSKIMSN